MDEAVKQTIQKAADNLKGKIEEDYQRRVAAAEEFKKWLDRTKLLSGGILTPMDLCESIAIQKKIQNIMALSLPRFLGNYNCKVYFQGFEGTEQDFIEQHPELKGSSGYKGVDVQKFSQDLKLLLTSKGNNFAKAFEAILAYRGIGVGITSGYLHLMDSKVFPLVNSAAKAGLQYYIGNQNRNTIRAFSREERERQKIDIQVSQRLQSYFGWSYLIKEFVTISGLDDFHKVDSFLWLTNLQHKANARDRKITSSTTTRGKAYWRIVLPLDTHEYSIWPQCKEKGLIAIGYTGNREVPYVNYMQYRMQIGDQVVAYLGNKRIGGIGTLTGEYEDYDTSKPSDKDFFKGKFWRRRQVKWDYLPKEGEFWTLGWTPSGTRHTIFQLNVDEFKRILVDIGAELDVSAKLETQQFKGFSEESFRLLKEIQKDQSYEAVKPLSDAVHEYVIHPLRTLFNDIANAFDPNNYLNLEKNKHIIGHLWKANPRLGAWPYAWGAFFPKDESRITAMQLFIWLDGDNLTYGIYPSSKNIDVRLKFDNNLEKYGEQIQEYLPEDFYERYIFYTDYVSDKHRTRREAKDYRDLMKFYKDEKYNIGRILTSEEVIKKGITLAQEIRNAFEDLVPLYVCGITDDPIGMLEAYYGTAGQEGIETDVLTVQEDYTLEQCAYDTGFDENTIEKWLRAIERKKQVIFYGPPGTGKTYIAEKLAKHLVSNGDGFYDFIQFHPAYNYEDFIQGIRPKSTVDGKLDYPVVPGRFIEFIKKAQSCKDICILIVDEINRANLARVFGELMYLLEYRDRQIHLASGGYFKIPDNVRIIGTMNTADRSIALVDHALRRRFAFLALYPQYDVLRKFHSTTSFPVDNLVEILEQLNKTIDDKHYCVGITFFLKENLIDQIEDIWQMEIEPYLEEYFFDQPDKVEQFRWEKIKDDILE